MHKPWNRKLSLSPEKLNTEYIILKLGTGFTVGMGSLTCTSPETQKMSLSPEKMNTEYITFRLGTVGEKGTTQPRIRTLKFSILSPEPYPLDHCATC